MKFLQISILLVLLPALVFAQKANKIAVLITANGDSIRGIYIEPSSLSNVSNIKITRVSDNQEQEFSLTDLKNINIENGERYLVAKVKMDITPAEFKTSFMDPALIKSEEATVMLLTEFSGAGYNLYSFRKYSRTHLYLQKFGGQPEELLYRAVTLLRNAANYEFEDKTFISQLDSVVAGCTYIENKTANLRYSIGTIVNFLKKYNKHCSDNLPAFTNEKNARNKLQFFLNAGVSFGQVSLKGTKYTYLNHDLLLTNNPVKFSPALTFGGGGLFLFPRTHNKLGIVLSANYISAKGQETEYYNYIDPTTYTLKTVSLNHTFFNIDLVLRYYFTSTQWRTFIEGGMVFNYMLKYNDAIIMDDYLQSQHTTSTDNNPYNNYNFNKMQFGYAVGAGIEYNQFCIEYKFQPSSPYSSGTNFSAVNTSQLLVFEYKLNKQR